MLVSVVYLGLLFRLELFGISEISVSCLYCTIQSVLYPTSFGARSLAKWTSTCKLVNFDKLSAIADNGGGASVGRDLVRRLVIEVRAEAPMRCGDGGGGGGGRRRGKSSLACGGQALERPWHYVLGGGSATDNLSDELGELRRRREAWSVTGLRYVEEAKRKEAFGLH